MGFVRGLLTAAAVAVLLLAATPWLDRIVPSWLPIVQSLGRLWMVLAVIGIVACLISRAWLACGVNVVAIAVALVTIVNVSNRPDCDAGERRLAVMSLNAFYGEADVSELASAVKKHDIDVLVIPEATEAMIAAFGQAVGADRFPHRSGQTVQGRDSSGTVILSRYPATRVPVDHDADVATFQQPALSVTVDGTEVLVRGVHPKPPLKKWLTDWRGGLLDLGRWQREQRGRPLVMAGDFNASAAHAPFRDAKRGMFDVGGWWPTSTWPMGRWYPPFVDIDHILVRGLSVQDSGTEAISGTDHRAVWADLRVCTR